MRMEQIAEHIRTSNFDCVRHNMDLTVNSNLCIVHIIIFISVLLTVNYCKCILFSPLNSFYVHWPLNKYYYYLRPGEQGLEIQHIENNGYIELYK